MNNVFDAGRPYVANGFLAGSDASTYDYLGRYFYAAAVLQLLLGQSWSLKSGAVTRERGGPSLVWACWRQAAGAVASKARRCSRYEELSRSRVSRR